MNTIAVMTTTDSLELARSIAAALVGQKLAACAQISTIESIYRWDDAIQNDQEFRVLIKTSKDRYADVEAAILELHAYDLPAIVAFDFTQAYGPFADWVHEQSST